MNEIGSQIRELRQNCKVTQSQLARYVRISQQELSRIELGLVPLVSFEKVSRILKGLGLDLGVILPNDFTKEGELESFRNQMEKSKKEMADMTGYSYSQYVNLENRKNYNVSQLDRVMQSFNLKIRPCRVMDITPK